MTATETMPSMDAASSLRALALSTLKSKRRKPAPTTQFVVPLSSRPPPPIVPSVDSMQLDYGEDEHPTEMVARVQSTPQENVVPLTTRVLMREEGEISEAEEAASRRDMAAVPMSVDSSRDTPKPSTQPLSTSPTSSLRNGGLSLLDRITDAPQVLPTPAESSIPLSERISSPSAPAAISVQPRAIHKGQVRPNVLLNQTDYDAAKDRLLDILGYGVPPEALLDLGLSREFIYYAFTELGLRHPNNLDSTGLLPYNPETIKDFSFIEPETSIWDRIQSASMPTTSPPSPTPSTSDMQYHPSSPKEDLDDIESLKRKELQARKAVLASRKSKKAKATKAPVSHAQPDTVDDFLKTLAPSPADLTSTPTTQASLMPTQVRETSQTAVSASPSTTPPTVITSPLPSYESAVETPSELPPSSTDSMTLTFKTAMQLSPEITSGNVRPATLYPSRRSLKRPVASDFVDLDPNASLNFGVTSHDNSQATHRKRPGTSFVTVKQPRTIIDISESEGEDEQEDRQPSPLSSTRIPPNRSNSGTVTPAVLQEKEREILKMRERIAEMERQKLLKKLGLKSVSADSSETLRSPTVSSQLLVTPSPFISQTSPASAEPPITPSEPMTPGSSESTGTPTREISRSKTPEPIEVDQFESEGPSPVQPVDVDVEMSASAQAPRVPEAPAAGSNRLHNHDDERSAEARHENPVAYDSLFASYPALRLSLQPSLAGAPVPMSQTSSASEIVVPYLKPLRECIWKKNVDPNGVLCQYEFPGGGVCRDANCQDVHLGKMDESAAKPSDHDTAKYLCSAVGGLDFDSTLTALQEEMAKDSAASLEDHVARALASRLSPGRQSTT